MKATLRTLNDAIGGLSNPSKMPCYSWSIPASECKVGSLLRSVKGSTCSRCYARKGRYIFAPVLNALRRRLNAYLANPEVWEEGMTRLLAGVCKSNPYFRWFDSGDIYNAEMLSRIVSIANRLPWVSFWLPTKEYKLVRDWLREHGSFPSNLCVRVSAPMIDRPFSFDAGVSTSEVSTTGRTCPAPDNAGTCGDCRMCWAHGSKVVYGLH